MCVNKCLVTGFKCSLCASLSGTPYKQTAYKHELRGFICLWVVDIKLLYEGKKRIKIKDTG